MPSSDLQAPGLLKKPGEDLPEGFQRSEFLLEKGFIDHIVSRDEIKTTLSDLFSFFDFGSNKGIRKEMDDNK